MQDIHIHPYNKNSSDIFLLPLHELHIWKQWIPKNSGKPIQKDYADQYNNTTALISFSGIHRLESNIIKNENLKPGSILH